MRSLILATAATLALGIAGCQREPREEPAAPEGSMEQQFEEATPGQQPGEAPETQEGVIPQEDAGMQGDATAPGQLPGDLQ